MGKIIILEGQKGLYDPSIEYTDTGWEIDGQYATHYPCNPGTMINDSAGLTVGASYVVTYVVDRFVSGTVRAILGTTNGAAHNSNGTFTETLTCAENTNFGFYSDGFLRVKVLSYYMVPDVEEDNSRTIAFNHDLKCWVGDRSFVPEMMLTFIDKFFAFKNGSLWQQNVNPVRNNFFGQQYSSKITFYVNINPSTVKLFYTMREVANKVWAAPNAKDIVILPYEGKSMGMKSRLKVKKFKYLQGAWFAFFLRNLLDPRFNTELDRLMLGEELRGEVMEITIQNDDTTEAVLFQIDVKTSPSNYTY
jgi:hypothetical protein